MKQGQPLLSISLLASNQIDSIRKCLDSLAPLQKAIETELIIVDTSTDSKVGEMLREYTSQVIPFLWCNDFSKARNVGLTAAKGDWFLYIDDDEWFEDTKPLIDFFISGEYKGYGYANYIQRNFLDPQYETYTDVWASRMIKLSSDTCFKSKIHEYLDPAYGKGKNIPVVANHTGYIYVTEEDRRKKFNRNVPLLLQMIAEEPDNVRWRTQLAQEYYAVDEWKMLSDYCEDALKLKAFEKAENYNVLATLYAGAVEGNLEQGQYEKAHEMAKMAFSDMRCNDLGKAYISLMQAIAYVREEKWTEAEECISYYFNKQAELTHKPEQYAHYQEALIVDSTFDTIMQKKAYSVLITSGLKLGKKEILTAYFDMLGWDKQAVYVFPDLIPVLVEELVQNMVEHIWICIWKNRSLYEAVTKEFQKTWHEKTNDWRQQFVSSYTEQTERFLRQYYTDKAITEYPEALPQVARNALSFIEDIQKED